MSRFSEWAAEDGDYEGRHARADLRGAALHGWNACADAAAKLLEDEGYLGNTPALIRAMKEPT